MGKLLSVFVFGLLISMTLTYVGWRKGDKTVEMTGLIIGLTETLFFLVVNIITIASPVISSALIN